MKRTIILAGILFLSACVKDTIGPETPQDTQSTAAKIVHSAADAQPGMLLVKFDPSAGGRLSTTATRSGVDAFDAVMESVGVTRLERLFPVNPIREDKLRAAGLHLWYKLYLDKDADLEAVAGQLASVAEVKTVEYNAVIQCVGDSESKAVLAENLVAAAATASGRPFDDPLLPYQWSYINSGSEGDTGKLGIAAVAGADINAAAAWKLCAGDPSIVVAVVDQGVKWSHEDLLPNMWVNPAEGQGAGGSDDDQNGYVDDIYGFNFVDYSGGISWDGEEDTGHGTHVAGTVAAVNNNGVGCCGVAGGSGNGDGVKIMSCQIFSNGQGGTAVIAAEAIRYAADNGAVVLQCSWGYKAGAMTTDASFASMQSVEKEAIDYFIATAGNDVIDGGVVIFSAGNEGSAMSGYPGGYYDYISVAAMAADYTPAYYTNYRKGVNITAPGGDVYYDTTHGYGMILSCSADNDHPYMFMQGTSMACPHVSGIAALGLSYARKLGKRFTVPEFKALLLASVHDINVYMTGKKKANKVMDLSAYAGNMGSGYIDAYLMLMNIESTPCVYATTGEEQVYDLSSVFGGDAAAMTFTGIEISEDARTELGFEADPVIADGKLRLTCTRNGSARITVSALVGGSAVGGGASMGAMPVERRIAIISRGNTANNGGWL